MKKLIVFASLFFLGFCARAQKDDKINWMTMEEAEKQYALKPKPILVDVYTEWCGWCKRMDKLTYSNKDLVKYVNDSFYAVRYDAEDRRDVRFNKRQFRYLKQYKINELALYLSRNQPAFPITVFLSAPGAEPAPITGFLRVSEIELPMRYFGGRANERETFQQFSAATHRIW